MKRSQSKRKAYDPHFWSQVHARMHCSLGDHDVQPGAWVRFRRGDVARRASCDTCLHRQYGITRELRPITLRDDGVDVRARRAGADE